MPEEVTATNVQEDDLTFPADPMEALRQEDEAQKSADLETALRELTGEETPVEDETVTETGEDTSVEAETAPTSVKRAPIDELLKALPDSGLSPEEQESFRATLATNTRLQQEAKVKPDVDQVVADAIAKARAEEQTETVDEDPIANVTEEQKALFAQLASQMGFVKKDDLQAEKQQESIDTYLTQGRETALAEFGDAFGLKDDQGNIVLSPGVQEALEARAVPIQEHGTLTLRDLYILTNHDDLIKAAEARGAEQGKSQAQGRRVERVKARTESNTSGVPATVNIRGEKGSASDSSDSVFSRAALLAKQALKG